MSFKVPIGYRQLEDNITEVVYDDNTTWDWVNGSGGGDDEGDEVMIVNWDSESGELDKTYKELKDAAEAGKIIMLQGKNVEEGVVVNIFYYYLSGLNNMNEGEYIASFGVVASDNGEPTTYVVDFSAATDTEPLVAEVG